MKQIESRKLFTAAIVKVEKQIGETVPQNEELIKSGNSSDYTRQRSECSQPHCCYHLGYQASRQA